MMRKGPTDGGEPAKEGGTRRYWVRAGSLGDSGSFKAGEGSSKRSPKARFLEPYRLGSERRAELIASLAAAGLGDSEGRELFATAVEYDIANARQSLGQARTGPASLPPLPPDSVAVPPASRHPRALGDLARGAEALAELIDKLSAEDRRVLAHALESRDPFRRGYGDSYLEALGLELRRIAEASGADAGSCVLEASTAAPPLPGLLPAAPADSPLGEIERGFVRRVARVYEECLESRTAIAPESPFLAVLGLLAVEAGVRLPADPGALEPLLHDP